MEEEDRKWDMLLPELLEQVSDRLPVLDLLNFRFVCKKWRAAPTGRERITEFSRKTPWFIFYDHNITQPLCTLLQPENPQICTFPVPSLEGATCLLSKLGWLLACGRDGCLLLCNPLSLSTVHLPKHPIANSVTALTEAACTFAYLPTSKHCRVFVVRNKDVNTVEISICCPQSEGCLWSTELIDHNADISFPSPFGTMWRVLCRCHCEGYRGCSCQYKGNLLVLGSNDLNCLKYNFRRNTKRADKYRNISRCLPKTEKFLGEFLGGDLEKKFGNKESSVVTSDIQLGSEIHPCPKIQFPLGARYDSVMKTAWIEPRLE